MVHVTGVHAVHVTGVHAVHVTGEHAVHGTREHAGCKPPEMWCSVVDGWSQVAVMCAAVMHGREGV